MNFETKAFIIIKSMGQANWSISNFQQLLHLLSGHSSMVFTFILFIYHNIHTVASRQVFMEDCFEGGFLGQLVAKEEELAVLLIFIIKSLYSGLNFIVDLLKE